ncbi:helix-turn-helix domain-containing protein [Vibrio chagasii]|uniref:helix-turn-helix domain-containing protein n=1 Tax=Vibrio chagasii TaxID=170679 RepID=UPI001641E19F|nr:helix-turn-helix domain-containing protein [Vibrio chagasii]
MKEIMQPDMPYLPVEEFARRWGVTPQSVRNMAHEGKLPIKKKKRGEKKVYINMLVLWDHAQVDADENAKDSFFRTF